VEHAPELDTGLYWLYWSSTSVVSCAQNRNSICQLHVSRLPEHAYQSCVMELLPSASRAKYRCNRRRRL